MLQTNCGEALERRERAGTQWPAVGVRERPISETQLNLDMCGAVKATLFSTHQRCILSQWDQEYDLLHIYHYISSRHFFSCCILRLRDGKGGGGGGGELGVVLKQVNSR